MSEDSPKVQISIDSITFKTDKGSTVHVCFGVHNLCDSEQFFSVQINVPAQDRAVDLAMIEAEKTLLARLQCLSVDLESYIKHHQSRVGIS